ncbi:MAG TPA: DMT family transporter [Flavobacteriaceae bacterium]|nr:DMT family transporter [Flavobacteriaceae bacterium]
MSRNIALVLATITAIIYGVSFTIAKDVMPTYIKPYGFILLRVFGATILFWISGLFIKKEKIELKDFLQIFLAAFFGVALNMLSFFKGLSMTTPISGAVMMVTTPILVLTFASMFLGEKATFKKIAGIFIGLIGAIILIMYGKNVNNGNNELLGNLLVFINAASFALYLIIVKSLTSKYHPLTFVKWLYLFGLIMVIPFGFEQVNDVDFGLIPNNILYKISFIVIFTTFITYLFNLLAIRKLKPTTVSIFIYLQPVIATIYALVVKSDNLNNVKIIATLLIFVGVYLVTTKSKLKIN